MPQTRIVTFLGLGNGDLPERYHPCKYCLDGHVTPITAQHDAAASLVYSGQGGVSILALGTSEALDVWRSPGAGAPEGRYVAAMRAVGFTGSIAFQELPRGRTEPERWEIFERVVAALSDAALSSSGESPDQVVLDITHGFRSQPFLAGAALAYALNQRRRQSDGRGLAPVRVLYAAFEPDLYKADKNYVAEVMDLSHFATVLEWNSAIDDLMRHGRADFLSALIKREQGIAHAAFRAGSLSANPGLDKLAKAAGEFADALATARIPSLITSLASCLDSTIASAEPYIRSRIPPLGRQLEDLRSWAAQLSADRAIGHGGVVASWRLAERYLSLQRFAEAAIALREGLVSAWTTLSRPAEGIIQPGGGQPAFRKQREQDERALGNLGDALIHAPDGVQARAFEATFPELGELAKVFSSLANLRNDIEHGGFQADCRQGPAAKRELEAKLLEVEEALASAGFRVPKSETGEPTTPVEDGGHFINCSNHSVAKWPTAQIAAARDLGLGDPVDFPGLFPAVNAGAGPDDILALAADVAGRIVASNPRAIHVAGEMTLTVALVSWLEREGFPCYSATTSRQSSETAGDDGSVERHSTFSFVAWRRYAVPGAADAIPGLVRPVSS